MQFTDTITASTRNQAIGHLATGCTWIMPMCLGVTKKKYIAEELYQEIFLNLCEMEEDKMLSIFNGSNGKRIYYYLIGFARNQIYSKTSKFYRQYKRADDTNEITEVKHPQFIYNPVKEEQFSIIEEFLIKQNINSSFKLKNGNSYSVELFELYYGENLSYGEISEKTGIPKSSVYDTIRQLQTELINYVKSEYDYYDEEYKLNNKQKPQN